MQNSLETLDSAVDNAHARDARVASEAATIPCDVQSHTPPHHRGLHLFTLFAVGLLFGMVMVQSQAISWYRIQEMFRFGSFHMYGIIASALAVATWVTWVIRRRGLNDIYGIPIEIADKAPGWRRYLFGGILFGLGWALAGACPGPIFVLIGHGIYQALIVLLAALAGTFAYGLLRESLPH